MNRGASLPLPPETGYKLTNIFRKWYYIGSFFSFIDHLEGVVSNTNRSGAEKAFLSSWFVSFKDSIDASQELRFRFYFDHVIPVTAVISDVKKEQDALKLALPSKAKSLPWRVLSSFRSTKQQSLETKAREKYPKIAKHLWSGLKPEDSDFSKFQQRCFDHKNDHLKFFDSSILDALFTLPSYTPEDYQFAGTSFAKMQETCSTIASKFAGLDMNASAYKLRNPETIRVTRSNESLRSLLSSPMTRSSPHSPGKSPQGVFSQEEVDARKRENLRKHPDFTKINRTATIKNLISVFISATTRDPEAEKDACAFISHKSFPKKHKKILEEDSEARLLIKLWKYTAHIDSSIASKQLQHQAQIQHILDCSVDPSKGNGNRLKLTNPKSSKVVAGSTKSLGNYSPTKLFSFSKPHDDALEEIRQHLLEYWQKIHENDAKVAIQVKALSQVSLDQRQNDASSPTYGLKEAR